MFFSCDTWSAYLVVIFIFFAYQISSSIIEIMYFQLFYFQAAWIVDDSDEGSDYDNENDDGMVLDEGEDRSSGQEENKYSEFDCDRASLILGDSDKETNNDSVMMVSFYKTH